MAVHPFQLTEIRSSSFRHHSDFNCHVIRRRVVLAAHFWQPRCELKRSRSGLLNDPFLECERYKIEATKQNSCSPHFNAPWNFHSEESREINCIGSLHHVEKLRCADVCRRSKLSFPRMSCNSFENAVICIRSRTAVRRKRPVSRVAYP